MKSLKMKKLLYKFIAIIIASLFILQPNTVFAQEEGSEGGALQQADSLEICTDSQLGVKFLCNTQWKLRTVDDAILIIISSEPAVTLTIAKIDSEINFYSKGSYPGFKKNSRLSGIGI